MFRRQRRKDVNMIRRAIDDERLPIMCADDAAEIRKQPRLEVCVQQWPPVFRGKNDVRQQVRERVCHNDALVGLVLVLDDLVFPATEWQPIIAHGDSRGKTPAKKILIPRATEWRAKVAHSESCGYAMEDSFQPRMGRKKWV